MSYSYDGYGWLSEADILGRSTGIAPPDHGAKTIGQPYPNWTGHDWVLTAYNEPPAPDDSYKGSWQVTRDKFNKRFTDAELVGMELASLDNPTLPITDPSRQLAAALRVAKMRKAEAMCIDLTPGSDSRAAIVKGMNLVKLAGILTDARIDVILNTPPTDEDTYKG